MKAIVAKPDLDFTNPQQLIDIAEQALQQAKKMGATDAAVGVSAATGLGVNVRMREVETIEFNKDQGLSITIYKGKKKGSASISDLKPEAIKQALEKACSIADYTQEDPCNGLAEKELLATEFKDLDLFHPWDISPQQAIDMAMKCEAKALDFDKRISNSDGAAVDTNKSYYIYANSNGFVGGFPTSRHSLSCMVLAKEKSSMERDYYYSTARDSSDLLTIDEIGTKAAVRTVARLNAQKIKTMQVPVVFRADIAKGLFGSFVSAVSGSNLYRKSSFLLESLDTKVFAENINITEDPWLPKALASTPYDSEGVATKKRDVITNGVLQGYFLSSYSARKLGMQTTANAGGCHNLIVNNDDVSIDALLKKMDKGVLVTEVMGQGVNMVTGDYSRGAFGFWVENGKIQYPVTEFTIAGNLKEMFNGIVAISNDVDRRSSIFTGSVLINEMTIAGE